MKKIEKFDAAKKREKSLQQLKKTDVKSDLGLVPNLNVIQSHAEIGRTIRKPHPTLAHEM